MPYQHSAPRPSFLSVGGIITAAGVSYAGHLYGQFDRRDTDADERREAQRCLNILSGHACASNAKGSTLSRHISNLDRYGVTHIRSVLSPASAEKWDATVARQVAKKELGGCIVPAGAPSDGPTANCRSERHARGQIAPKTKAIEFTTKW